jgi:hypothetical protein
MNNTGVSAFHELAESTVCRMKRSTAWHPEADRGDRQSEPDDARSGNVGLWDVAAIQEIDAKQRKPPLVVRRTFRDLSRSQS